MKRIFSSSFILFAMIFSMNAGAETVAPISAQKIYLKPAESKITWLAKKVTGQHHGTIQLKSGEIIMAGAPASGNLEIDMTSIVCEDLKDSEKNAKLVNHLKSDDFFNVEKFPTATLVIKESKPVTGKSHFYDVVADLTIKGVTNSITFPMEIAIRDGKTHALGKVVIDRTKWNVRYGSGKFFKGLGDKMIYDDFEVSFDIISPL